MPLPDPESPEQSLGDCAICMDAIILEGSQRRRKSLDQWGDHGLGSGGGGLLNAVQMGVGGNGARKNYSLAPCHHLFVSCRVASTALYYKLKVQFLAHGMSRKSELPLHLPQTLLTPLTFFPCIVASNQGMTRSIFISCITDTLSSQNICPQCRRPLPPL